VIVNGLKLLAISAARPIQCRLSHHPDGRSCVAIVLARAVRSLVVKLQRAETSTSEIERVQG
jgi:hypothetical protein